jgi:predicted DNA binding CopG/RHH family protein
LEEVTEPVFEREMSVTVHLSSEDAVVVHEIATANGLNDAELIREWVAEKVHGL